jgi:hypothetical protein
MGQGHVGLSPMTTLRLFGTAPGYRNAVNIVGCGTANFEPMTRAYPRHLALCTGATIIPVHPQLKRGLHGRNNIEKAL